MEYRRFRWFLATLLLTALFAVQMLGQSIIAGDLTGTVIDPSGAVVSGATLTIKSTTTDVSQTTTSNSTGAYRFPLLRPGDYKLTVSQKGFKSVSQSVTVAIGQVTTANVKMELGSQSEVLEVTGAAPLIQTENANISTGFNSRQIDELPNGGNDLTAVAQTAPGVLMNTANGGGYGNFEAFGLPATSNLFTVNGNDEMDPYLNLNNSGATNLMLGKNEVQETAVVSNGYTGQYGRQAGAQIDYATKSGGNSFHGNLAYWWNGRLVNANDWFNNNTNTPRPFVNNNQWAASFGGPIKKDKAFFFVDTEGIRPILATSTLTIVPSQAYQQAIVQNLPSFGANNSAGFYSSMFNLYNGAPGLNRAQPTDNSIDGTGNLGCGDLNTDAAGGPLPGFAQFGGLNAVGPNGSNGLNGGGTPCSVFYRSTVGQASNEWVLATKLDFNLTNNDKVAIRYKNDIGDQPTYTDPINPVFNAVSHQPQYEGQLHYTRTISPTVLNQFILSGSWYSAIFKNPDAAKANAAFPYAMYDFDTSSFANMGGEDNIWPQGRNVTQYQIVDDLSITRGGHSFKFGGNFRRNDISDYLFGVRTVPRVRIFSQTDFATGFIDQISQRHPQNGKLGHPMGIYSFGIYGQDEWRVSSSLKLTLTVRADRNSNITCNDGCISRMPGAFTEISHDPNAPLNAFLQTGFKSTFPSLEKVVVQPRFGFAWNPFGKSNTVLRGGVGLFSDLYPGTLIDSFARNAPVDPQFTINGAMLSPFEPGNVFEIENTCNTAYQSTYASGGNFAAFQAAANGVPCASPDVNAMVDQIKNPKFVEWNFELQQAIGQKTSVSINYVGNRGYDIFIFNPFVNSNASCSRGQCAPDGSGFGGLPLAKPDVRAGNVSQLSNSGTSNYNGVTASISRRLTYGFQGSLNYTWSHALDDVSNGGISPYSVTDSFLGQFNPYGLKSLNYSNADYDVRHNLTANYVWDIPYKSSNKVMNYLVGGWSLAGTFFWRSRYPYSPFDSSGSSLLLRQGVNGSVLASKLNPGASIPDCNTPGNGTFQCLNIADWGTALQSGIITGTQADWGNQKRNTLRGPKYFNSDFSIMKRFHVTERSALAIGATAFNVFNHANFANPTNDVESGQFGLIESTVVPPTSPYGSFVGSAVSGRLLQLHARIEF